MDLSEINWDFNEAGAWPKPIKIGTGVFVCVLIVSFWFYQFTNDQLTTLDNEKKAVEQSFVSYGYAWRKAINLELHQKQYKQIESFLAEMMKLMPTKAEVASLLVDISQTGLSSGLEFELFKPTGEINKGDVIELPINIKVFGEYSELGLFISGLATLPRIVTIKNIQINPLKKDRLLAMEAIITTYRETGGHSGDAKVLDNSTLVCLDHDGLKVKGCKRQSTVNVIYPGLVARLKEKRKNVRPVNIGIITPMPPIESFLFNPEGLRDPFRPIDKGIDNENKAVIASNGIHPNFNRHKEELEEYSLDTLRMVGTLKMKGLLWGLIKTNDGTINHVKQGNYMGRNNGRILRVTQDKIELMEIVPDQPGTWRERQTSIALTE